jgi:predicted amidohydrolase YtcJ
LFCAFAALAFAIATVRLAFATLADLLLLNGRIVTLDAKSSVQQAIAIERGHMATAGSTQELRKPAGPSKIN